MFFDACRALVVECHDDLCLDSRHCRALLVEWFGSGKVETVLVRGNVVLAFPSAVDGGGGGVRYLCAGDCGVVPQRLCFINMLRSGDGDDRVPLARRSVGNGQ